MNLGSCFGKGSSGIRDVLQQQGLGLDKNEQTLRKISNLASDQLESLFCDIRDRNINPKSQLGKAIKLEIENEYRRRSETASSQRNIDPSTQPVSDVKASIPSETKVSEVKASSIHLELPDYGNRFNLRVNSRQVTISEMSASSKSSKSITYQLGQVLGKGHFGAVYEVQGDPNKVIKLIKNKKETLRGRQAEYQAFRNEIAVHEIMNGYPGEYGIKAFSVGASSRYNAVVMDKKNSGELFDLIVQNKLSNNNKFVIIQEIVDQLLYLNQNDVRHRDIKPENIFMTKGSDGIFHASVGDFGLGAIGDTATSRAGTEAYTAPEIHPRNELGNAKDPTKKGDVWSLGMTLFVLIEGYFPHDPFCNYGAKVVYQNTLKPDFINTLKKRTRGRNNSKLNAIKVLISEMCAVDPRSRPNMQQVKDRIDMILNSESK